MRCTLPLGALALVLAMSAHAVDPFQASDIRIDGLTRFIGFGMRSQFSPVIG